MRASTKQGFLQAGYTKHHRKSLLSIAPQWQKNTLEGPWDSLLVSKWGHVNLLHQEEEAPSLQDTLEITT